MKKGLLKRLSAVVLAAVMAVSLVPVMGTVTGGAVGQVEAKAEPITNGNFGYTVNDDELSDTITKHLGSGSSVVISNSELQDTSSQSNEYSILEEYESIIELNYNDDELIIESNESEKSDLINDKNNENIDIDNSSGEKENINNDNIIIKNSTTEESIKTNLNTSANSSDKTIEVGIVKSFDLNKMTVEIDETTYEVSDDFSFNDVAKSVVEHDGAIIYELENGKLTKATDLFDTINTSIIISKKSDIITYQNKGYQKAEPEITFAIKKSRKSTSIYSEQVLEQLMFPPFDLQLSLKDNAYFQFKDTGTKQQTVKFYGSGLIGLNQSSVKLKAIGEDAPKDVKTNIKMSATISFTGDTSKYINVGNCDLSVANLDVQSDRIANAIKNTEKSINVSNARKALSSNTAIALEQNELLEYFSTNQIKEMEEFLTVWLAEIVEAQTLTPSKYSTEWWQKKVLKRVLGKLGVSINTFLFFSNTNASIDVIAVDNNGYKRTVTFSVDTNNYHLNENGSPYAAFGDIHYDIQRKADEDLKPHIGSGVVTYANMETFSKQVADIANSAISGAYNEVWGKNANKVAEMFIQEPFDKLLSGKFSNKVYELLSAPTKSHIKKISVKCPVDITILDSNGNICCKINDNEVDEQYMDVYAICLEDEKHIFLSEDDYVVAMVGTAQGELEYVIEEYEDGELVNTYDIKALPLNEGTTYYSTIPQKTISAKNQIMPVDINGNRITDNGEIVLEDENDISNEIMIEEGFISENVSYELYENGLLKIKGEGEIPGYSLEPNYHDLPHRIASYSDVRFVQIGDGITSIGRYASYDFSDVEIIEIGDGVNHIEDKAFYTCNNLQTIHFGSNVPQNDLINQDIMSYSVELEHIHVSPDNEELISINDNLLSKDGKILLFASKRAEDVFAVPDNVERVNHYALSSLRKNIKTIYLPESVKEIDEYAFADCAELENINLPQGIKYIGKNAFYRCSKLENINEVDEIEVVDKSSLPTKYFEKLQNNTSVNTPIYYGNVLIDANGLSGEIIIRSGTIRIGANAFEGCGITSVIFPDGLKSIGHKAFHACPLKTIDLNSDLEIIEEEAFSGGFPDLNQLQSIQLPEGLKYIGNGAFDQSCDGISEIRIPSTVEYIGDDYFKGVCGLRSIIVDENNAYYSSQEGVLYNKDKTELLTVPRMFFINSGDEGYFLDDYEALVIPDSVIVVNTSAFDDCNIGLEALILPPTIKEVSFGNYNYITDVALKGDAPKCIGNLNNDMIVHVGENAKGFDEYPWTECKIIRDYIPEITVVYDSKGGDVIPEAEIIPFGKSVFVTSDVPKKEGYLFLGWSFDSDDIHGKYTKGYPIKNITNYVTLYAVWWDITSNAGEAGENLTWEFDPETSTLNVRGVGSMYDYYGYYDINTPQWQARPIKHIVIEEGVQDIGYQSFSFLNKLEDIVIPDSVKYINGYAFYECSNLKNIQISDQIINIEFNAFWGCDSLIGINVDSNNSNYASIDGILFDKNLQTLICAPSGLIDDVKIPDSVTAVRENAFRNCRNIKAVHLPNNINIIQERTFYCCDSLETIYISKGITEIEDYAFGDCNNLKDVYYSGSNSDWNKIIIGEGNESLKNATIHYGKDHTHTWDAGKVTKAPTVTTTGVKTYTCTECGETKTEVIPKLVERNGWQKENGYWYFYGTDGSKAVNTWKKDSKGWCWLQEDGAMLTNGWAKDSKGYCWIGEKGYMVEQTKWIKVDGSWYHITNGYRDQSKWMKDSKGWCYLGKDGKMVTNGWAKDSKGWCWMGADGYWVSNKWIQSGGQWYYIKSNHYMAANEWAKDSGGWMWMDNSGKITRNKWIKSGGYWYYLKSNGYMATGTQTISGKTYKFDSSGRWIS